MKRAREVKAAGGVDVVKRKLDNFDTDGAHRFMTDIQEWEKTDR